MTPCANCGHPATHHVMVREPQAIPGDAVRCYDCGCEHYRPSPRWYDAPCPTCGAKAGEWCWNLRYLHAFNPNRLSDHQRIMRPHAARRSGAVAKPGVSSSA